MRRVGALQKGEEDGLHREVQRFGGLVAAVDDTSPGRGQALNVKSGTTRPHESTGPLYDHSIQAIDLGGTQIFKSMTQQEVSGDPTKTYIRTITHIYQRLHILLPGGDGRRGRL